MGSQKKAAALSKTTEWAHRGYLIRLNPTLDLYYISKDGAHIGSAQSLEGARAEINALLD